MSLKFPGNRWIWHIDLGCPCHVMGTSCLTFLVAEDHKLHYYPQIIYDPSGDVFGEGRRTYIGDSISSLTLSKALVRSSVIP